MNNDFFNSPFFKNDPSEVFKDLGKQVYNQFSSRTFPTNIYEQSNAYILDAELPGIKKADISLKFEHSTLTIKAYKNINVDNKNLQLDERTNGELLRRFEFEDINKDAIEASYEDGVLSVTLPKKVYEGDDTTTISIH